MFLQAAQVPFARIGQDDYHRLAAHGVLAQHVGRGAHSSARGNAAEHALRFGQQVHHGKGRVVFHRLYAGKQAAIQHGGHEIGADALNLMRPGVTLGEKRRGGRLHRDELHIGLALTQIAADARDGAARAHARHQRVHMAFRLRPDFGAGGQVVRVGVFRVVKLRGDKGVFVFARQRLGPFHRAAHAGRAGGEHHLRAIGAHQLDALDAGHTPTRRRIAQMVSSEGQTVSVGGRRAIPASDLADLTGVDMETLERYSRLGLITPDLAGYFPARCVQAVTTIARLECAGVDVRVLRAVRQGAERSADIIDQTVSSQRGRGRGADRERARARSIELGGLFAELHRDMLEVAVSSLSDDGL